MGRTWREKYNTGKDPIVKLIEEDFSDLKAGTMMLISTPKEIDEEVRKIPKGQTKTILDLRQTLANKHGADGTCPLTTGIFLRIGAEVALEDLASGKSKEEVMPFWRIIDPKSSLAKKLSCGSELISSLRHQELSVA